MSILRRLFNSSLLRNITTVASGAVVAQIITAACIPVIARMFGPEAMGAQGVFVSLLNISVTLFGLGYPMAIVLAKNEIEAKALSKISIYISIALTIGSYATLILLQNPIAEFLDLVDLPILLFLVPIASLLLAINSVSLQWFVRAKMYGEAAKVQASTSVAINATKLIVGALNQSATALLLAHAATGAVTAIFNRSGMRKIRDTGVSILTMEGAPKSGESLLRTAKQYKDFPLLRTPQTLVNAISVGLPVLALASFFGSIHAGQYSIALSILFLPVNIIGNSITSVFYPRIGDAIKNDENFPVILRKAVLATGLAASAIYIPALLLSPWIFPAVLGQDWLTAGIYAQAIAPALLLQFTARPLIAAVPALRYQGWLLIYEITSTAGRAASLLIGFNIFSDAHAAVILFSLTSVISYIILIMTILRRARLDYSRLATGK